MLNNTGVRYKKENYDKGFVISKDGTSIAYRQMGIVSGLILLHGGVNAFLLDNFITIPLIFLNIYNLNLFFYLKFETHLYSFILFSC